MNTTLPLSLPVSCLFFCFTLLVNAPPLNAAPDVWDPDFDTLGIVYEEANVQPGQRYWKLVEAYADDPDEGGGRINIFYRTRDLSGNQIAGVWVRTTYGSLNTDTQTKAPPDWGDFPQSGGNWCPPDPPGPYTTFVIGRSQATPDPSDRVVGMGLPCNYHWSYRLTFEETIAQGSVTPTPTLTPTSTPGATTPSPTPEPGQTAWKMTYARQYGEAVTGGVAGQVELFAALQDGTFARAGFTNRFNSNTAIFGYTSPASDPFTPGNLRIAFDINVNPYDFHVYEPGVPSDESPNLYWLNLPHHGHYKWELWFRKIEDDSLYEFFPYEPVYHYDRVNGFNTATTEAANYNSDSFGLTNWTTDHWQTFVIPAGVNRIIGAKSFAVRQEGAKFRMIFSIHEGDVGGTQVGPEVVSREKSSNEWANVKVNWGMEDVPVTPGGTYALRVRAQDGQGFNMYGTQSDNYLQGSLYNGTSQQAGRDMVAVVVGAQRKTAPVTPSPTPSTTPEPGPAGVFDFLGLFDFAHYWQVAESETSFFETGYDIVADGRIDDHDLLAVFDTWHQGEATPVPSPTPSPTLSPTLSPTPQATATPGTSGQLLANPSFEFPAGITGANPTSWVNMTVGSDPANQGVINYSEFGGLDPLPGTYPDGSQIARSFVTSWGNIPSPHGWYQQVAVTPGAEYVLSGYVWTSAINGGETNQTGRIGVDVNGASTNVSNVDAWCGPSGAEGWVSSHQTWTRIETTFTAQAATVTVYVDGRNLQGVEWSGVHFDMVTLTGGTGGPTATPSPTLMPGETATPGPTYSPTPTPTSTPTPGGNVVLQVPFESFTPVNWGPGLDFQLPVYSGSTWTWPLHDGGDWGNIDFGPSADSQSGSSAQIRLSNIVQQGIRGAGLELLLAGDRALVPNKMHTVTVWAKSDLSESEEYSDLILAREVGSCECSIIQAYSGAWRDRATGLEGWQELSITFRSNVDTSVGDKILIAFAGASAKPTFNAVFDDLVITQVEP